MIKRILGAGLGWSVAGPIGALLGWWVGGKFETPNSAKIASQSTTASDFLVSLLILCSKVMQADGEIRRSEVIYVKEFLIKNFGNQTAQEMMQVLKDLQNRDFSLIEVAKQIESNMKSGEKIQLLYLLFGVAKADGELHKNELIVIEQIAELLGLKAAFVSIKAMHCNKHDLHEAYEILGIPQNATFEAVKKAYRELSLLHHPDRVNHLGKEVRSSAEEKFKRINAAYQVIKKYQQ